MNTHIFPQIDHNTLLHYLNSMSDEEQEFFHQRMESFYRRLVTSYEETDEEYSVPPSTPVSEQEQEQVPIDL